LRREEIALLAGVSVDYYTRLEQGRDSRPSAEVLDALGRALQLDDDGRAHLHALARTPRKRRRPARPRSVSTSVRRVLDSLHLVPAMVLTPHLDVLATNPLGSALFDGLDALPAGERNMVRLVFLDPRGRSLFPEWDTVAGETVAYLRAAVGTDPYHPRATELIGELSIHSAEFRRLWSRHDVREKASGTKRFRHPLVGELSLAWDTLTLPGARVDTLITYTAPPDGPDHERLALLASLLTPSDPLLPVPSLLRE
jgi:transcriptional regulator with XRE-family HTH domain